ncbi:MAG TPA: ribonucleoside-diphosphate reductase subunit alpha, partial [Planctomycetaceae bacterium]|nr:ribonucleoside-diphosphate reductase subunit alpha [Planctomycetaceae bacterium]
MIRAQTEWVVTKRGGRTAPFDASLIGRAISNAFRAELNLADNQPLDDEIRMEIPEMVESVANEIAAAASSDAGVEVEKIQDVVEMMLMRRGHYRIARRYIVYRAERAKLRALRGSSDLVEESETIKSTTPRFHVILTDGTKVPFDEARILARLSDACRGLEGDCSAEALLEEVMRSIFDGISVEELYRAMILAARTRIERDPAYDTVASRLMLKIIYNDALGNAPSDVNELNQLYVDRFPKFLEDGIAAKRLTADLHKFDLSRIALALEPKRDHLFQYLGLQAIFDRYLLHIGGRRIETPQYFWMRVSMGLAIQEEGDATGRAIEFYNILSSFRFTSATPTLFNSATLHPQLSSCYLSTVNDDLDHIFKCVADNAKLSKWAGGLGNDWTQIRATNSHISGTNGQSQGVIPFLK